MAWKRGNPGDPCCDGCPPILCSDGVTQKRIVTRTLELSFPDTLVFVIHTPSLPRRDVVISTGWAAINGTYTWHINQGCQFVGTFPGVDILEERRSYNNSDGLATCLNYESLFPVATNHQLLDKSLFTLNYGSLASTAYIYIPTAAEYYRIFFDFPLGESAGTMCEETELSIRVEIPSLAGEFCSFPGATAIANTYE